MSDPSENLSDATLAGLAELAEEQRREAIKQKRRKRRESKPEDDDDFYKEIPDPDGWVGLDWSDGDE